MIRNDQWGFTSQITTGDDDEHMQTCTPSPRSSPQTLQLFPSASLRGPITEVDLELRLGLSVHTNQTKKGMAPSVNWNTPRPSSSRSQQETKVEKIKLKCPLCLDKMKEETSTPCGHIFCRACIVTYLWDHDRCPICRTDLPIRSIHRIYLPRS